MKPALPAPALLVPALGLAFLSGIAAFAQTADTPKLKPIAPTQIAPDSDVKTPDVKTPDVKSSDAKTSDAAEPQVAKFAALEYFNKNCARCHGTNGSFYGDDFGKGLDDAHLRDAVDSMAKGPGGAPIDAHDLTVLTAWHRALRDKKPFVSIVKAEPKDGGWILSGEISPGAQLQINGETVPVEKANWTHQVAAGAIKVCAKQGEAVTEFDADTAAWAP